MCFLSQTGFISCVNCYEHEYMKRVLEWESRDVCCMLTNVPVASPLLLCLLREHTKQKMSSQQASHAEAREWSRNRVKAASQWEIPSIDEYGHPRLYQNATTANRTKAKSSNEWGSSVDLEWQLYQDISDHESLMCSECLSAMGQVVISWHFTWGLWRTGFMGTFSEATSVSRHGFSCDQRACMHSTKWICFPVRCDISEESD